MKSLEEIEVEFKNQIVIPKTKPKNQFFFCPAGYIGSGKTTITKQISEKFNLVRISSDELRLILKENGYDYSSLKDIVLNISKKLVEDGFSLAFDMNCGNPITKEKINKFSNDLGIPVIWVRIDPPEEFIINNIKSRNNIKIFQDANHVIDNYFFQKKVLKGDMDKISYSYKLDPSKTDFQNQMNELYSLISTRIS